MLRPLGASQAVAMAVTHVEGHGQFGEGLSFLLGGEADGHIVDEPRDGAVRPDDGVGVEVGRGIEREGVLVRREQRAERGGGNGGRVMLCLEQESENEGRDVAVWKAD